MRLTMQEQQALANITGGRYRKAGKQKKGGILGAVSPASLGRIYRPVETLELVPDMPNNHHI
jgi:hypothetical protein